MKIIFIPFIILTLTACSNFPTNNVAGGYIQAYLAINDYLFPMEAKELYSREQIDNIPYASMLLSIGESSPGLIILETANNNNLTWVSADSVYIVLKHGRIIKVQGLGNNLTGYKSSIYDFAVDEDLTFKSYYSYDSPELNDLEVINRLSYKGLRTVNLFIGKKPLYLFEETIVNDYLGWKKTNFYWVDKEGFVWKSIQHVSPKLPSIQYEVTKKPVM